MAGALQAAIETQTKAVQDLTEALGKLLASTGAGAPGAPGGAASPGNPTGPYGPMQGAGLANFSGFATPFWQQPGKIGDAIGDAFSPMRQILAGAGMGQAAGVVGSLGGGIPGMLGQGAGLGMQIIQEQRRPDLAARDAALGAIKDAPFAESESAVMERLRLAARTARAREEAEPTFADAYIQSAMDPSGKLQLQTMLRTGAEFRQRKGDEERFLRTEQDLVRRGEDFFSGVTGMGGQPTRNQIRDVLEFFKPFAEAQFTTNAEIQNIASQMMAEKQGSQSRRAGH